MYCQNNKHLKSIADDSVDESVESNESVYKSHGQWINKCDKYYINKFHEYCVDKFR